MSDLAFLIQRYGADQITGHLVVPARSGYYADWPDWVPDVLREVLTAGGIARPWTHQVLMGELLHLGQHAVLATGTGSGKSLAVWLPVLSEFLHYSDQQRSLKNISRKPSTLYLAPTKALSKDQESKLSALCTDLKGASAENVLLPALAAIDADTQTQVRRWAREYADIIFSNPDFIHYALLSHHKQWARFLRSLSTIVIDEFHHYRGNFGSQVALILRRLLRIAKYYNAHPKVVFLSATSVEPEVTAKRFLGDGFGSVFGIGEADNGSPRGERNIFTMRCREMGNISEAENTDFSQWEQWDLPFFDPDLEPIPGAAQVQHYLQQNAVISSTEKCNSFSSKNESGLATVSHCQNSSAAKNSTAGEVGKDNKNAEEIIQRSAVVEAGELTSVLVSAGAQTLTFVRSRAAAERVAEVVQHYLSYADLALAKQVRAYRGGYLPEERRELEAGLRDGSIRALATTSALELGIDISSLDAVVVTGWPGTNASFQQQIGRAGRGGTAGVAIFIGRENPLDQYILEHPQLLAQTPSEISMFDPQNPWILPAHLCAAAAELPLTAADYKIFGLTDDRLFQQLAMQDLLKLRPRGWYWNTSLKVSAHGLVDVRGASHTVSIIDSESGTLLGTVSAAQADTTVFPGAIYVHQGKLFKVERFESDAALVHPHNDADIRTYANEHTCVSIESIAERSDFPCGSLCTGIVRVENRVLGYDVRRVSDGMYLRYCPLDMPAREFSTGGTWFTLQQSLLKDAGISVSELAGALHAVEHTMISLLPLFAACDRWDLGGLSTITHPDTGEPTVIIHDSTPEGSGCALRGFQVFSEWVQATLEVLNNCACSSGCPRCIQSPKCGNNNEPLSKTGAKYLLEILLAQMSAAQIQHY